MADSTLAALSAATALDGTELIYGTQSGGNVKITGAQLTTLTTLQKLSAFAATTSAELAGVISNETGSGLLVFATSPTLTTPILGTPTSGTLTNCTLPIGGLTGLGTGIATFLMTPSSANLIAAVTDETGTGALVFSTTPTLVTPVLGVATGTSIALGGATLGANALAITGTVNVSSTVTCSTVVISSTGSLTISSRAFFKANSDGVLIVTDSSGSNFGRLQFGGSSSSFPAIKRSATAIAHRLADDSADCPITAAAGTFSGLLSTSGAGITVGSGQSLTLGNAAVTGLSAGVLAALTNATIVITDSAGQAYRIPCII